MIKKNIKYFLNIVVFITAILTTESFASNILKIGVENAKVNIKVFSSLTCPHCASFHNKIFANLKDEYIDKEKVKFEHHSFPLDLAALNAEKILRCPPTTEISFQLLSEIYKKQNKWAVGSDINIINEAIMKIGLDFNLDKSKMKICLSDEKVQEEILNERIEAQKNYKISSTPTIYINEKKYEGKHEYKEFKKKLDKFF